MEQPNRRRIAGLAAKLGDKWRHFLSYVRGKPKVADSQSLDPDHDLVVQLADERMLDWRDAQKPTGGVGLPKYGSRYPEHLEALRNNSGNAYVETLFPKIGAEQARRDAQDKREQP